MKIVIEYEALKAVRDAAQALVSSIDAALAVPADPARPCLHHTWLRKATPTMGHPGAWVCACGAKGDQ